MTAERARALESLAASNSQDSREAFREELRFGFGCNQV